MHHAPQCLLWHCLQWPGHGGNLDVHQQEWIGKMWYIYTMEYFSAIGMKLDHFIETWIVLETVLQSKVSPKKQNKYHILMHICGV